MGIVEAVISAVALVAAIPLIWGMVPVIQQESRSASRNLMIGVMICLLSSVVHIVWFGAAQVIMNHLLPGAWHDMTFFAGAQTPHLIFGLSFLVALFFFYRFTWFLIPESERVRYNLLTSPLWPRHVGWIWPRRDRRENDA